MWAALRLIFLLLHAPLPFYEGKVDGVIELPAGGSALLVRVAALKKVVILFIGPTEAQAIALRIGKVTPPRPLTHDLLDTVLRTLGGRIERAQIVSVKNGVFFGRLWIRQGARLYELDARASDTVALAVGARVPIQVAREVAKAAADEDDFLGGTTGSKPSNSGKLDDLLRERHRGPEGSL